MTDLVEVRPGIYHDSVTLMRITQAATAAPGVTAGQVAMATPLNTELAVGLGFSLPEALTAQDLLVTLRGIDQAAVEGGLAALDAALLAAERSSRRGGGLGGGAVPRTVRGAVATSPDAALVLLSVPGDAVLGEAMDAIEAGRHVMIFSDNVPLAHEVTLKDAAARAGVLVMGPDCGTAIVAGVGLGFANVLRSGGFATNARVGIVAASGTGAQQLCCLLDEAGVGISHVLGVGGRDLSEQVAGRSALTALALLDADPGTDHIVIISKPAHPATAERIQAAASAAATPVTVLLIGSGQPDITAGTGSVLAALGVPVPIWPSWGVGGELAFVDAGTGPGPTRLRGLFSGGTLADEAMVVMADTLGEVRSNIPLRPELALPAGSTRHGVPQLAGLGHAVVDLGDDAFTQGRGHPMIDPSVRLDLLAAQAEDPEVGVVLLDVVLGHAADPDPAGRLAPAIAAARSVAGQQDRLLRVVISLCGTAFDPQDRERQADALTAVGAEVFSSNAAAARHAARLSLGAHDGRAG